MLMAERTSRGLSWLGLVRTAGRVDLVTLAVTALVLTDLEAAAIAVALPSLLSVTSLAGLVSVVGCLLRLVCAIPGHTQAGMEGALRVT